jgi:hypothetical protein
MAEADHCCARHAERADHRHGRHRLRASGLLRQSDRDSELRRIGWRWCAPQQHAHDSAVLTESRLHPHRAQPPQPNLPQVHGGGRLGLALVGRLRHHLPSPFAHRGARGTSTLPSAHSHRGGDHVTHQPRARLSAAASGIVFGVTFPSTRRPPIAQFPQRRGLRRRGSAARGLGPRGGARSMRRRGRRRVATVRASSRSRRG